MKNIIFISPNFPENYWNFCYHLKNNGMNVLGIGDCPYDNLTPELKGSMNEYYKVSSLENYDEVYRAVAFYIFKYGKIDWLESNNEYWLERDAQLRTDFNINSGFHIEDMPKVKYKSRMKENYIKAGVPVARFHMVDNYLQCKNFIDEVGYPVIVKPDNGVGAAHTYKLKNDEDLKNFLETKDDEIYIMEEFITGQVVTFDSITNSKGETIFETGNVTPNSLMDIVNDADNCVFYIRNKVPEKLAEIGRKTLKAFGVKSRFTHFEFFLLTKDQYLGKEGDIVALEVNMRPSGGISPTMMNYANGTDVYKIWADMIAFDKTEKGKENSQFCVFAGRRNGKNFVMSHDDIYAKYGSHIVMEGPVAEALSNTMGNYMYIATFDTEEETNQFVTEVFENH
ncbi:MAG: ATP-grasp domain-containing protein [Erysipelotrichaceae bacterium]|nr:ATP-grasp domain-containing protein [Erysipelotrichaceae bacterium]